MVAELDDVLEKVLIDFGRLFQRIGAVRLYERLDILREEVVDGCRYENNGYPLKCNRARNEAGVKKKCLFSLWPYVWPS